MRLVPHSRSRRLAPSPAAPWGPTFFRPVSRADRFAKNAGPHGLQPSRRGAMRTPKKPLIAAAINSTAGWGRLSFAFALSSFFGPPALMRFVSTHKTAFLNETRPYRARKYFSKYLQIAVNTAPPVTIRLKEGPPIKPPWPEVSVYPLFSFDRPTTQKGVYQCLPLSLKFVCPFVFCPRPHRAPRKPAKLCGPRTFNSTRPIAAAFSSSASILKSLAFCPPAITPQPSPSMRFPAPTLRATFKKTWHWHSATSSPLSNGI